MKRAIIRETKRLRTIRPVQAGNIVHDFRSHLGCRGPKPKTDTAIGCCIYASTDGVAAIRRLEKRGILTRVGESALYAIVEAGKP